MKKINFLSLMLVPLICAVMFSTVEAQIDSDVPVDEGQKFTQPARKNILRELNLTNAQVQQIRLANRENQPRLRESRQRSQAANRALDEAIYGGNVNDAEIQARLREAQTAHSEFLRNRTLSETAISKILNPNQLLQFRNLRQQNRQTNLQKRQNNNQAEPVQPRLNRMPRLLRNRRLRRNNL